MISPLLVYFDRWFRAYLEAVSTTRTLAVIGHFGRMIAAGIDPVGRQDENIYRADVVAAQTTAFTNFL
jgi:hypothetical protein